MKSYIIVFYLINLGFLKRGSSINTNTSNSFGLNDDVDLEERSFPYLHDANNPSDVIEFLCSGPAECVRLSNCRIMVQLLDKSCMQQNKLHELTCGYTSGEPMVCCPKQNAVPSRPAPPYKPTSTLRPTTTSSVNTNDNDQPCGVPHLHNWRANNYKGIGSQPWVVRIGFKNKVTGLLEHPCCGSIIGPRVVMTAAHCALKKQETLRIVSVRIGEYDVTQNPDCTQTFCALPIQDIPLSHVVVHPVSVQPICLHQSHAPLEGYKVKLVGWGKLPGDTEMRKRQQQLDLPVVNMEQCKSMFGSAILLNDNELCVGGEEGKDACSGFGGAPLVLLQDYGMPMYTQVGIVSFGSEKCGMHGVPSVYVRVDKYIEWIKLNSPQE